MRFTQASIKYNIPKGTLYDNILGKSNRMEVLAKSGLKNFDENAVLEFCCDLSASPYNRRTRKPLSEILQFVYRLENCNHQVFDENGRFAYRWWWAFCKKYSIVSLHYDNNANIKMTERNWFSRFRLTSHHLDEPFHFNMNISFDYFISLSCLVLWCFMHCLFFIFGLVFFLSCWKMYENIFDRKLYCVKLNFMSIVLKTKILYCNYSFNKIEFKNIQYNIEFIYLLFLSCNHNNT